MKKKSMIIILVIFAVISTIVASLGMAKQKTQTVKYTMPVQKNGVRMTKETMKQPTYFLPVGKECDLSISAWGPEEFISDISISIGSADSAPIYTSSVANGTINTGKLKVDDKEIFITIEPEARTELDAVTDYSIEYKIELHSNNYQIMEILLIVWIAISMVVFAFLAIFIWNRNNEKEYDERQIRMRGVAAMNTLIVVIIMIVGLGAMSEVSEQFILSTFDCASIVAFVGFAVFAIVADMNDAYTGIKGKNLSFAIPSIILGAVAIMIFVSYLVFDGQRSFEIPALVEGICFLAIGIEMVIKSIRDKKEAAADEES